MTYIEDSEIPRGAESFLAFDPGETTGWALHGPQFLPKLPDGLPRFMGSIMGLRALTAFLEAFRPLPDIVIVERYVISDLDRDKNSGELETVQAIGIIKSWCYRNKIPVYGQLRDRKPYGYGWSPIINSPGSKANSHKNDAHAHNVYFQVKHKFAVITRRKK